MKSIGEGIAFAGLCASAAFLEYSGGSAEGLWALVVIWAILSDWGKE